MRKYITETKKVKNQKLVEVLCNKCGKVMSFKDTPVDIICGCFIQLYFGYGSRNDGDLYKIDLCDDCIDEFFDSFTHQPVNIDPVCTNSVDEIEEED